MTTTDRLAGINEGVAIKAPCIVATTANITLSGTQTIDGVAVVAGDRVLVKDQTTGTQNGIYVVSAGTWERAKDFNGSRDVVRGTQVFVISGTTNAQRTFYLSTTSPVIGTSSLTWDFAANTAFVFANEATPTETTTGTSSTKLMTPRRTKLSIQSGLWYQRSGTSTVAQSVTTRLGYDLDLREWATSSQLASDAATYWNNAMGDINTLGGGLLRLPPGTIYVGSTVDNKYPRVLCSGAGYDFYHDGGNNSTFGTVIVPTFAGTVFKHRTPYSSTSSKFHGGGFVGMSVIGNSLATRLLEVDSINGGVYDLYLADCVGTESVMVKAGITGTDLAEACDVQQANFRLRIRNFGVGAPLTCKGVVLTGSSNANVSFSKFDLQIQCYNADALDVVSADNNEITLNVVNAGGSGRTVIMRGPTASHPVGGDSNLFHKISGAGAVYAEGTDTGGVTAGVLNIIRQLDTGNGTPDPTHGTGSVWVSQKGINGAHTGFATNGAVVLTDYDSVLAAQRANVGTETARVYNSSSNHFRLTDGTNEWGFGIDGATGDLRYVRLSGSGKVNLSNGVMAYVGSLGRQAPITKTADFSVADNENWYINNKSGSTCTVTLPTASSYTGREIMIQNYQAQTVISASSNVVPLGGGSAATAILAGTAGKWATLVSDGTNWVIMQAGG